MASGNNYSSVSNEELARLANSYGGEVQAPSSNKPDVYSDPGSLSNEQLAALTGVPVGAKEPVQDYRDGPPPELANMSNEELQKTVDSDVDYNTWLDQMRRERMAPKDDGISRLFGGGALGETVSHAVSSAPGTAAVTGISAVDEIVRMGAGLSKAVGAQSIGDYLTGKSKKLQMIKKRVGSAYGVSEDSESIASTVGSILPYIGMPGAASGSGILGKTLAGAGTGALAGAAQTPEDGGQLDAAMYATGGAALGGALSGTLAGIGKGASMIKNSGAMAHSKETLDMMLNNISSHVDDINPTIRKGAQTAIDNVKDMTKNVVKKLYNRAYSKSVDPDDVQKMFKSPEEAGYLAAKLDDLKYAKISPDNMAFKSAYRQNPNGFQVYDELKKVIDSDIEQAISSGNKAASRTLGGIRRRLVNYLDSVSSDYTSARAISKAGLERMEALGKTNLAQLANAGDDQVASYTEKFFKIHQNDLGTFKMLKNMMVDADPNAYKLMLKTYMQNVSNKLPYDKATPLDFFKKIAGNETMQSAMKEALTMPKDKSMMITKAKFELAMNMYKELAEPSWGTQASRYIPIIGEYMKQYGSSAAANKLNREMARYIFNPNNNRAVLKVLANSHGKAGNVVMDELFEAILKEGPKTKYPLLGKILGKTAHAVDKAKAPVTNATTAAGIQYLVGEPK